MLSFVRKKTERKSSQNKVVKVLSDIWNNCG